jgi:hypothetical protein
VKGGIDWGIPVLYMRSFNGVIFPEIAKKELVTANGLRIEGEARIKTIKGGNFNVVAIDKVVKANYILGKLEADTAENYQGNVVFIKEA